jgi:hypothetical protein
MEPKIKLDELLDEFEDASTIGNPGAVSGTLNGGYITDTITGSTNNLWDSTTISGGGYTLSPGYGAAPNVSITTGSNTGPYTMSATGGPFTINSGAGTGYPWATNSTKIQLDGKDADIKVNGWSLVDAIQKIEQRLNILHPNTELEAEWEELRALGNKYRELEQQIKDKQATWDRLKAMPPPMID